MKKLLSKISCILCITSIILCSAFAAAAADYSLGDVDGDNTISVKDATKLQMYLAGLVTLDDSAEAAADVNQNGTADIGDVTCIQKYVARIIASFDEVTETTAATTSAYPDSDSEGFDNVVVRP